MLRCKEANLLISESLDRKLSVAERFRLKTHLMMCNGCTNYSEQLAFLRKACRRYADQNSEKDR